jgi:hypothetical protein
MLKTDFPEDFSDASWWDQLNPTRLDHFWQGILRAGVRAMGTPAAEAALGWIEECLASLPLMIERLPFEYEGWSLLEPVLLTLLAPETRPLRAEAFLLSAATPPGGLRGKLAPEPPAQQRVWGMYTWDRWRIIPLDDSNAQSTLGYLSGRPGKVAIPQLLPTGAASVPHFIVGEPETSLLRQWQQQGTEIILEGRLPARSKRAIGVNLSALWQPANAETSMPELVVSAHYDTVYTTPGAYDNASGCALLLELAHVLTQLPPDQTAHLPAVRWMWFGAEELDLGGSRAYVEQRQSAKTLDGVCAALNLDGFGRGDLLEIWAGPETAAQLAWDCTQRALKHWQMVKAGEEPLDPPQISLTTPPPPGSDHAPFYETGIPVIMLTFNDQEIIHRAVDLYDTRMLKNMARGGRIALSLISSFLSPVNWRLITSPV